MDKVKLLLANPAVLVGLVRALLILITTFGVALTQQQTEATLQTVGAFLTVASLVLTGVTVLNTTGTGAPVLPQGTEVTVTTPKGEPDTKVTL